MNDDRVVVVIEEDLLQEQWNEIFDWIMSRTYNIKSSVTDDGMILWVSPEDATYITLKYKTK